MSSERREFKRVHAPVYCRPIGLAARFMSAKRQAPGDISLGGLRMYSDEEVKVGTKLELELFLPSDASVTCQAEVAWVETLSEGAPARFDIGLKFLDVKPEHREQLRAVLNIAEN